MCKLLGQSLGMRRDAQASLEDTSFLLQGIVESRFRNRNVGPDIQ